MVSKSDCTVVLAEFELEFRNYIAAFPETFIHVEEFFLQKIVDYINFYWRKLAIVKKSSLQKIVSEDNLRRGRNTE